MTAPTPSLQAPAVFLSYASEDTDSARRLAEALRAADVEVWLDQDELRGGDAWDRQIRHQIRECTLFVPLISVHTQARLEGYFRLEWKLAAQRTHAMASAKAFLLPVAIDGTPQEAAHVPEEFQAVQWTRLPEGAQAGSFCNRVKELLAQRAPAPPSPGIARPDHERRLAAIVFTDVVGYSALMQRDETGTMALVQADFAVLRSHGGRHGGAILNTMGDGMLLQFGSAVEAVAFAMDAQREFEARAPGSLRHRIGIHLGDVMQENGQLVGDGVNIAARLQSRAIPGCACISRSVYDAVHGKADFAAQRLGRVELKNIANPTEAFLIAPTASALPRPARRRLWLAATVLAVAAAGVFLLLRTPPPSPASVPADRSVAVLPFTNMSDEKENAFFADGVHEDLLTNLAGFHSLRVISRTSVMQYRGTLKNLRQIAQELGVAYIVEGSVRRAGSTIRVTGQLIRTATDEHVWAKTYDRELKDVFAVQTELSRTLAAALDNALSPSDLSRSGVPATNNLEAYDAFKKAQQLSRAAGVDVNDLRERIMPLYEKAVQLDPNYVEAWAALCDGELNIYSANDHTPERLARAQEAYRRATQLAADAYPVVIAGINLGHFLHDRVLSESNRRRVIELFPGRPESHLMQAQNAWMKGLWLDAQTSYRAAMRLDPRNIEVLQEYFEMLDTMRHYVEAEEVARQIIEIEPEDIDFRLLAASMAYRRTGNAAPLRDLVADATRLGAPVTAVSAVQSRLAYLTGDWQGMVALWKATGQGFRTGDFSGRAARFLVATALLKTGDRQGAYHILDAIEEDIRGQLKSPKDITASTWASLAAIRGMRGEKSGVRDALNKAKDIIAARQDPTGQYFMERWDYTLARSWIDDKHVIIPEIRRLLREPATGRATFANVHLLHVYWLCQPLHNDPDLLALMKEPENNAPLY